MLQDIGPGRFVNHFSFQTAADEDYALVYQNDSVLASVIDGMLRIPKVREVRELIPTLSYRYCFTIDQDRYFFADADSEGIEKDSDKALSFVPSREYRNMGPMDAVFACCVGESLHRWHRNNQFCGRCGTLMEYSTSEQAIVCPQCGLTVYPKICPAVIVAVCDGDRLLLTKYRGRAFKRYALVAGFHEIGETIEDTVHREVLEETGLHVKNLRFYKSQPWVLTDTLLMGFYCELDGSDTVTIQEDELSVAEWFHRSELPDNHSGISLTGEMIERFRSLGPEQCLSKL